MTLHIYSILIICVTIFFLWKFFSLKNSQLMQSCIVNFPHYRIFFESIMEKSFDIIYKDRILVFSLEGVKPSEAEFKSYSIDFINLVLKLMGPNLKKELVYLYGNEETLLFTMAEYFNTRSEQDEIKEASINTMMEQENV